MKMQVTCYISKRCVEVNKKLHARCTKVYYFLLNHLEKCQIDYNFAADNITVFIFNKLYMTYEGNMLVSVCDSASRLPYAGATDYMLGGSLVATNGTVDKILFDGGFADVSSSGSFVLFYYNKDHLGNNREALIRSGSVLQVTRYYPFGAQYAGSTEISGVNIQPYKYNFSIEREKRKLAFSSEREKNRPKVNGKELDRMHGLNTYDYGARQYNPILGRWDRMDPLCEKYYSISPYAYCANNPIVYIDPDGKLVDEPHGTNKWPNISPVIPQN